MDYYIDIENDQTQIYTQEKIFHNLIIYKADYKSLYRKKYVFFLSSVVFSLTYIQCLKSSLQVWQTWASKKNYFMIMEWFLYA